MEDEIITDVDCSACNAVYTLTFDTRELRGDLIDTVEFHCTFCGVLMEPYYDDIEYSITCPLHLLYAREKQLWLFHW